MVSGLPSAVGQAGTCLWYSKWTVDTDEFVLVWLGLGNRPNATLKAHTSAGTGANNGKSFPDYLLHTGT